MRSTADFTGVVVAAGEAARFGGPVPKQFADLDGRTVVARSVAAIASHPAVAGVVLVLAPEEVDGERGRALRDQPGVLAVVAGGASRAASVRLGLAVVETPFVLVHDAARPLVSPALVDAVVRATRERGAAIPALQVWDTVKRIRDGTVERTVDRSALRLAQTPQGARRDELVAALDAAAATATPVTDEASALETAGRTVACVDGDADNLKITRAADLDRAARQLGARNMELRVGSGFDIHRIDPDRELVLGGVRFPDEAGLDGHSDADVILHAAMDALLGAVSLGDIGRWFPPDDPAWAGADSVELSRQVASMLAERGAVVVNLDITLLAQRPRIAPHAERMRETIAAAFGVERDRVGLKATTLEKLGALGRHEGIAAQAVALVRLGTER